MSGERTLPGLAIKGFWTAGTSGWDGASMMDGNWLKLSVTAQLTALSRVTALPGSPTDGQIYIVPSGGDANKVAVRDNGAWTYYVPVTGWRAWVVDEATEVVWNGTAWSALPRPVAIGTFSETSPLGNQILLDWVFADATVFADDFAGSRASVGTNPTATFTAVIQKNGSSVGSLAISTSGVATFATTGTTVSFAAGDLLTVVAPGTPDATIARLRLTLKGIV